MDPHTLIWVDLRIRSFTTDLCSQVPSAYRLRYVRRPEEIPKVVATYSPEGACFQYDDPGEAQLKELQRMRLEHPPIPVLMLTVKHSEELAVWALRMRVWDYLVLPVSKIDLAARLALLVSANAMSSVPVASLAQELPGGAKAEAARPANGEGQKLLLPALSYIEENYSEKVALGVVARLCGIGRFQFSRIFKRVHGKTFREFLILHRINKAIPLLARPGASITDVAFAVGFNDLSHFAQMFRRYVGICPSDYLHQKKTVSQARVR